MARRSLGSSAMSQRRTGIGKCRGHSCLQGLTAQLHKRLLNSCVYGHLFADASPAEVETLRMMGHRWKQYEKEGKWKYEGQWIPSFFYNKTETHPCASAHPFWCTGYTFVSLFSPFHLCAILNIHKWDLHSEAPDLFQHLSESNLVIFKGDLNHRKSLPLLLL